MTKKRYERPVISKHYSGLMNKYGGRQMTPPKTHLDGIAVKELTEKFGSPLFVMSEKQIRNNQQNANRIFKNRYPKVQFAWSYKTNYLDAVCSVFHQENSWAEVVSSFEYEKAKKLGVKGEHIIFNGPDKSSEALLHAIKDTAKIHIDHFDELYEIKKITETEKLKAKVAIRINMDVGVYPKWDRFGFNLENGEAWQAIQRIASNKNLQLIGLHSHIGTYMMSAEAYRLAAQKLSLLAKSIKTDLGIAIEYLDLGGGFASHNTLLGQYLPAEQIVPTFEQFADAIASGIFSASFKTEELPLLILETGRALVDDAGFLLSTVLANKRLADQRRAIIIDAGVNILFTSFWYKHKITPAQESGMHSEDVTLYGPLCMNIDCVRESIVLPPLNKGDRLVIEYVGAYDMTQWMQFIQMRPNVVMIMEDGTVELIRKSENLEYLLDREILPVKFKKSSKQSKTKH
ncbi:MAG: diaminopimelate decarboxylase [Ignavibacteria bacterium CG_4_8_14_3_um_filter_37_9]|nr:diaminopimelate decarboxylase [Ignavibacteria bacterium]OIO17032.1 MAG: diaminopimelate decarboxylase [Ignavibacteria bacterium CG1_02_37_35]PIS46037.1 MAG: diaminopimelate decarboxylase [Ignavibacteria bacterium CG08_land_8_20_14_0_20_37_9]PIW98031.1 MAG: diaminopimelate decarboxylase [Ignavibacteria bacterium CG_4_8_14_3_um_filter_37_9]PIX94599.1 MAG: diaminopimelate decarboxylase [Ignavibacteria bacterium CG_4_10_14_3_um_filter_37_18]PJC60306.1 MAG: diaminopimelate decarboxylase [Ignavib